MGQTTQKISHSFNKFAMQLKAIVLSMYDFQYVFIGACWMLSLGITDALHLG